MGDPGKLILLESILNVINREKLLENVNKTGGVLRKGLLQLEKEFPGVLNSTRGRGTFLAVNAETTAVRDKILKGLMRKGDEELLKEGNLFFNFNCFNLGVQSGGCGTQVIRLRPALVFQEKHANIYLETLRGVIKEL